MHGTPVPGMLKILFVTSLFTVVTSCGSSRSKIAELDQSAETRPVQREFKARKRLAKSAPRMGISAAEGSRHRTWKRSSLQANLARLKIGDKESLPLKGVQAHVRVDGFRARVLLDFYFYNPHRRSYEGTFQLRLPQGATPYYLAFGRTVYQAKHTTDVRPRFFDRNTARRLSFDPQGIENQRHDSWTQVKVARMVPKAKAALAYHSTVRRRVDPALLEWSGSGIFNGRIFPLQPRTLHRVVIGYDLDLTRKGKNLELQLALPAGTRHRSIHFDIARPGRSRIRLNGRRLTGSDGARVFYYDNDPKRNHFRLQIHRTGTLAIQGTDQETGPYFATRIVPTLPTGVAVQRKPRAVFLVDTALHARPDDFNKSLKALQAILEQNQSRIREFTVVFYNIDAHYWKKSFVANNRENRRALKDYADRLALEGASDLGNALQLLLHDKAGHTDTADLFLLTPGAVTWGETRANALARLLKRSFHNRLFVYSTGASARSNSLLSLLAHTTGGAVFSIDDENRIDTAAKAYRTASWKLERVSLEGATDLLVAGNPSELYDGQQLTITGRGRLKPGNRVVLTVSANGRHRKISIPIEQILHSELAPRMFGQIAVQQMETLKPEGNAAISAYALHFRVTGRSTSLVMLDTEADYRRYRIKPQANSFLVSRKPATAILSAIRKTLAGTRLSARQTFLALVSRLQKIQSVHLEWNAALRLAARRLPGQAFRVNFNQRRHTSPVLRTSLPAVYRRALRSGNVSFEHVLQEYERRRQQGRPEFVVLSNLVHSDPGNIKRLRMLSYYALKHNRRRDAYYLLQRLADRRPYEPQTYLAIARVLTETGQRELAALYYEIVVNGLWDIPYTRFGLLARIEYLQLLQQLAHRPGPLRDYAGSRLESLRQTVQQNPDLLISIEWNTEDTDIDLHVIEPHGEEVYYSHRRSSKGGRLSADITGGFGPEIYRINKAQAGTYRIGVDYFSNNSNRASLRTAALVHVYRNVGRKNQTVERKVILLESTKDIQWLARAEAK